VNEIWSGDDVWPSKQQSLYESENDDDGDTFWPSWRFREQSDEHGFLNESEIWNGDVFWPSAS
jgi:hypothetical protein